MKIQQKLNPYGFELWDKLFVLPEEIRTFTGGVIDYPDVAKWEAEIYLKLNPGWHSMQPVPYLGENAFPQKVVLRGLIDDFQIVNGRIHGEIREPKIAYDAGSLWQWLVDRIGVAEESTFTVSTADYAEIANGGDIKVVQRHIQAAQARGRDYLNTGDPVCPKLVFKKIGGRIYFDQQQVSLLHPCESDFPGAGHE